MENSRKSLNEKMFPVASDTWSDNASGLKGVSLSSVFFRISSLLKHVRAELHAWLPLYSNAVVPNRGVWSSYKELWLSTMMSRVKYQGTAHEAFSFMFGTDSGLRHQSEI